MSELVEKVAKVLCRESGDDPDMVFTDQNAPEWEQWTPNARAAIKAVADWLNEEGAHWYKLPAAYLLAQLKEPKP